eukprot:c10365_g1_i1.p1 GENE.c10365_g1_i1~~c10365_g1_i1.p1  ORF type:complete len:266 (-),score=46.92 c10365_g1_i1:651-1409(-)
MIKTNKHDKPKGRGGARRGAETSGGPVRQRRRQRIDQTPYERPPPLSADEPWQHDMFEAVDMTENNAVRRRANKPPVSGARIEISNLDWAVSNSDIQELFRTIGQVEKAEVDFDRTGRSLGTAQVTFTKIADAKKAFAKFNGVELDGKKMNLKLIASQAGGSRTAAGGSVLSRLGVTNAVRDAVASNNSKRVVVTNKREPTVTVRLGTEPGLGSNRKTTGGRGRGGRGGRGGKKPTAMELDTELNNLYSDNM